MKPEAMTIMLGGKSMSEDSSKISFVDAYAVVLNRECELIAFRDYGDFNFWCQYFRVSD